jgi:DNA-binding CsgD family transcriptional regulator
LIAKSVEAWEKADHSVAGAARQLDVDPRTVKAHLAEAGVSISRASNERERVAEARQLHEIVGSTRAVAALLGVSVSTARRHLGKTEDEARRGRPRISEEALDQAELAYGEHGSIRAAARATGISPGGFSYRLRLAREREQT